MSQMKVAKIKPSQIDVVGEAWVLQVPRLGAEGTHYHTYGLLTPYFKGLTNGQLLATRCVNPACPISKGNGELWLPPRADCPDCCQPMVWSEIKDPRGYIYTYTYVERGGTGLEIPCPYYQIDVKLEGVKILDNPESAIVTVVPPPSIKEETPEAVAAADEFQNFARGKNGFRLWIRTGNQ